jgi:hypothetical protein
MNALEVLMQSRLRHLGAVAMVLAIAGCNEPTKQRSAESSVSSPPIAATAPPAVNEAAATEKPNAARTANANDQPQKPMNKQEESTSMPQPGQANDHSTLAGDGKK